jgi:hypothetical protein
VKYEQAKTIDETTKVAKKKEMGMEEVSQPTM